MKKLPDLMVPEKWLVVSRSGTVGNVLYMSTWLARCAVTDHAIRIEPKEVPAGFLYAFLSSPIGQVMIERGVFGATVDELEPKHLAAIPVPIPGRDMQNAIDAKIVGAYAARDQANGILRDADIELHRVLGVTPFDDTDIAYLGDAGHPAAFVVPSSDLAGRLDASNHVPVAKSALKKLRAGRYPLVRLGSLCREIRIPARFKRRYVERTYGVPYLLPSQLLAQRPYGIKSLSEGQAMESPGYLLNEGELLLTTDGTIGRVHPVTARMDGWFGSNNMARLNDSETDMGFLYAFLATPYGQSQVAKDIYGGVIDHITEEHISSTLCPDVPIDEQRSIGSLVRKGFALKDAANDLEDEAMTMLESSVLGVATRAMASIEESRFHRAGPGAG